MFNLPDNTRMIIGLVLSFVIIIPLIFYVYSILPVEKDSQTNLETESYELMIDNLTKKVENLGKQVERCHNEYKRVREYASGLEIKILECKDAYEFILSHCDDY